MEELREYLLNNIPLAEPTPECPDEETLWAYLDQQLDAETYSKIKQHVIECGYCRDHAVDILRASRLAVSEPAEEWARECIFGVQTLQVETETQLYEDQEIVINEQPGDRSLALSVKAKHSGEGISEARIRIYSGSEQVPIFYDFTDITGKTVLGSRNRYLQYPGPYRLHIRWFKSETARIDDEIGGVLEAIRSAQVFSPAPEDNRMAASGEKRMMIDLGDDLAAMVEEQNGQMRLALISDTFCVDDICLAIAVREGGNRNILSRGITEADGKWNVPDQECSAATWYELQAAGNLEVFVCSPLKSKEQER